MAPAVQDYATKSLRRIGDRIAAERTRQQLSQRQLSELTGVHQVTISRIESGSQAMTGTILLLLEALHLTLEVRPAS